MSVIDRDTTYKLVTAGAAFAAGYLVKAGLTMAWRAYTKNDPPQNPEAEDVNWSEALMWTVASSVAMGVAGLVARKGAASLLGGPRGSDEALV